MLTIAISAILLAGLAAIMSTSGTALAKFNQTPAGVAGGAGGGGADSGSGKGGLATCSSGTCTTIGGGGGGGTSSSGSGEGGGHGGQILLCGKGCSPTLLHGGGSSGKP